MVMESTDDGLQGHWNAAANWVVTSGSLANSVAVDSSDTPTDLPDNIVSTKSPLILRPPSSDSVPCEITINFSKRHEVRQVYVRSTARVYEIYVTPKVQGDNEYLCTVRCGIAAKEEISNVAQCNEDGSPCLGESKHGNDEEWVQVKVPNASGATNGVSTASVNPCMDMDLYEATAEISDADPCISLTLKLVSVQSKGCVYVDEVYIFADPVDIDSDIQEDKARNFAGSSALAMLIPSILQISRAKAGIVEHDKHNFGLRDNQRSSASDAGNMEHERLPEEIHETPATAQRNEEEMKHHVTNDKQTGSSTVAEQPRQNSQFPDNGRSRVEAPCGRVETLLEQMVSRVSRMEDLYLRFEESMLRPINSIEARLQQVELKIESLVERQLNDGERGCKRFSAPEYSLSESNVNSMYGNETENYKFGEPDQYLHKDEASDKSSQLHDGDGDGDGDDILETTPHLIPCLTITAPEFSQCDEDDNSSVVAAAAASSSSVFDSAKEKPRQVSIDDALATALAGFMSSVPVRRTQLLMVKAPDFSNEEDDNFEEKVSPEIKLNVSANSSSMTTDGVEFSKDPTVSCLGNKVDTAHASDSIITVEKSNEEQHNERDILQETEGIREVATDDEAVIECSNTPPPPPHPLTVQSSGNGEINLSLALDDTEASNAIHASSPVIAKEDSQANVIQDLLLAYSGGCASVVDFKTPILDVTFSPQDTTTTTLECLLGDESAPPTTTPDERNYETCSAGEQQHQLIVLDDEMDQISKSGFSLDTAYCDLPEMAVKQQHTEKPDDEQLSAGSLI